MAPASFASQHRRRCPPSRAMDQQHVGSQLDAPVTVAGQSEGQAVERAVLVRSSNTAGASGGGPRGRRRIVLPAFPRRPARAHPPQLKNGFVGRGQLMREPANFVRGQASIFGRSSGSEGLAPERNMRLQANEANCKCRMGNEGVVRQTASERWELTVRLSLSKNKLKWSGQRGTQIYVKCT